MTCYSYHLRTPVRQIFNVGWLDATRDFATGVVDSHILAKLERVMLGSAIIDVHFHWIRGVHRCALSPGCKAQALGGEALGLGSSEILVPDYANHRYFAAPSLIFHYIRDHRYVPPQPFLDAVVELDLLKPFRAPLYYLELVAGHF